MRTAASGSEALRLAQERLPNVVVVDIAMPEHDGFWLVAQLRKLRARDLVPAMLGPPGGSVVPRGPKEMMEPRVGWSE